MISDYRIIVRLLEDETGQILVWDALSMHLTRLDLSVSISPSFCRWEGEDAGNFAAILDGMAAYIDGPGHLALDQQLANYETHKQETGVASLLIERIRKDGFSYSEMITPISDKLKTAQKLNMTAEWNEAGAKALRELAYSLQEICFTATPDDLDAVDDEIGTLGPDVM